MFAVRERSSTVVRTCPPTSQLRHSVMFEHESLVHWVEGRQGESHNAGQSRR
jgi:hypothetical protein